MGACASAPADEFDEKSKYIDKELRQAEKQQSREVKILLLGAGESGKTTILKQMKLIHTAGFNAKERAHYRTLVFGNMLESIRLVLEAMEAMKCPLEHEGNDEYIDLLLEERDLTSDDPLPAEFLIPFKSMWRDAGVQLIAKRGNEYALHDNMFYFFEDIDRLFKLDYVPTDQDILRCRLKTIGITESIFELRELTYRMFDVGGQRSERKKWIHCFENVTALLFLVAISGYDQCLAEDIEANQMQEALMLFDTICNSQWFVSTATILFLNKIDLFKTKLATAPIQKYFPEFDPSHQMDYNAASLFFQQKFVRLNKSPSKDIYSHFTNATDTTLLKNVMLSVTDIILQKNLHNLIL